MQSATRIEARSNRQAMDWSLVLISQEIENVVEHREDGTWALAIAEADLERARHAISAYERENATPWQQEIKWTGLLFDWRSIFCFFFFVALFGVTELLRPELKLYGRMDRGAFLAGEWWRLFTAVTLHADVAHLAANVSTGIVLLGLAMGAYGPGPALLASFLAGGGANLFALALRLEPYRSLGASGMVMAALGLLTVHSLSCVRGPRPAQWIGRGLLAGVLLVVLLGLDPKSDVLAHLGGFLGGCIFGVAFSFVPVHFRATRWLNLITSIATAATVVACWALAIAKH